MAAINKVIAAEIGTEIRMETTAEATNNRETTRAETAEIIDRIIMDEMKKENLIKHSITSNRDQRKKENSRSH